MANYSVKVSGQGYIQQNATTDINFTNTNGGFTADVDTSSSTAGDQFLGTYTNGIGWEDTLEQDYDPDRSGRGIAIRIVYPTPQTGVSVELDYNTTFGSSSGGVVYGGRIKLLLNGVEVVDTGTTEGEGIGTVNASGGASQEITEIQLICTCGIVNGDGLDPGGTAIFTGVRITTNELVKADAAYYTLDDWQTQQQSPNGSFLYIDGASPAGLAALSYSPSHVYEFVIAGTGSKLNLSFTDGWDGLYSNNEPNKYLKVEIAQI